MRLLSELNEQVEYLIEAKQGGGKNYFLEGTFLQGNIKNRNGRVYPTDVLAKEVANYTENFINRNRSFGELNHPANPSINLDKVSHLITELKQDGDNFTGKAKILQHTPNGKIVTALMEENCSLGVSSRSLGALKEMKGAKYVTELYITTAADIVADPSAPDAFVSNIMENAEWFFDGVDWRRQETAVTLVEDFKRKHRKEREEKFLQLFKKLLNT